MRRKSNATVSLPSTLTYYGFNLINFESLVQLQFRFTIRTVKTLSTEEKGEIEAKIVANRATVDIYQQKQELKSLSQLALNELKGQVGADEDATMDSRDKNAERQGRRDQKRAKKAEKEAKFLARMEEKKASGEWVEKTKWKAMERKTAAKVVEKDDSDSEKGKSGLK